VSETNKIGNFTHGELEIYLNLSPSQWFFLVIKRVKIKEFNYGQSGILTCRYDRSIGVLNEKLMSSTNHLLLVLIGPCGARHINQ